MRMAATLGGSGAGIDLSTGQERVAKSGSKNGKREFYPTAKVIMRLIVRAMADPLPMNDHWTSRERAFILTMLPKKGTKATRRRHTSPG